MTLQQSAEIVSKANRSFELFNGRKPSSMIELAEYYAKYNKPNTKALVEALIVIGNYTKNKQG